MLTKRLAPWQSLFVVGAVLAGSAVVLAGVGATVGLVSRTTNYASEASSGEGAGVCHPLDLVAGATVLPDGKAVVFANWLPLVGGKYTYGVTAVAGGAIVVPATATSLSQVRLREVKLTEGDYLFWVQASGTGVNRCAGGPQKRSKITVVDSRIFSFGSNGAGGQPAVPVSPFPSIKPTLPPANLGCQTDADCNPCKPPRMCAEVYQQATCVNHVCVYSGAQ